MKPPSASNHERLLTLSEAADRLQWSVRTLTRKLKDHGIRTVGRDRIARLEEADLRRLIEAERQPEPIAATVHSVPAGAMDPRMRSYHRRWLGQPNRRKPAKD